MSRRSNTAPANGLPPSHPAEHYPAHRAFLIRSLNRCDTDQAALVELNRSLHKVKADIMETCGEATLLDLGEGLLKLSHDGETLEGKNFPSQKEAQSLCVDFLLRMKLRRKLLNRLSRRLNRLAHAMDGQDVVPPPPPKYGDLRLQMLSSHVAEHAALCERQEKARKQIELHRQTQLAPREDWKGDDEEEHLKKYASDEDEPMKEKEKEETPSEEKMEVEAKDKPMKDKEEEAPSEEKTEAEKEDPMKDKEAEAPIEEKTQVEAKVEQMKDRVEEAPSEKKTEVEAKDEPMKDEVAEAPSVEKAEVEVKDEAMKDKDEEAPSEAMTSAMTEVEAKDEPMKDKEEEAPREENTEVEAKGEAEKGEGKEAECIPDGVESKDQPATDKNESKTCQPEGVTSSEAPNEDKSSDGGKKEEKDQPTGIDYDAFRDYDEPYTKEIMLSTGAVRYPVLDAADEGGDHNAIKYGGGLGATHRSMSSKEKEVEFKRWQASILSRIPDQPTFDELGMTNRVFNLEERRKRLAEGEGKSPSPKKKRSKKKKKKADHDDMSEDSEGEVDEDEEYKDEKDDAAEEKKESEDKKDDDEPELEAALIKPVKPISFAAVPSFHEQDHKRMRIIHADLMAASIHDHARHCVSEATMEYNQIFRRSNQLYNMRVKIQSDLNNLTFDQKMRTNKRKNDYNLEVAVARSRWQKEKRAHDIDRARRSMPAAFGKPTIGTALTAKVVSQLDPVSSVVGMTMANVVDAVVIRAESGWKDSDRFPDFQPPPPPKDVTGVVVDQKTGETLGQRQERQEAQWRKELADFGSRLHASEEQRKKAWKKLLKTKSEFEVANSGWKRGRMPADPNQYQMLPLPPLRANAVPSVSSSARYSSGSSMPTYVPPAAAMPSSSSATGSSARPVSDSKYSIARVKERIAPDGSVMPVSEPRKTPDGLYLRPAGRTRKGMDWDPVRGIWVPAPNQG